MQRIRQKEAVMKCSLVPFLAVFTIVSHYGEINDQNSLISQATFSLLVPWLSGLLRNHTSGNVLYRFGRESIVHSLLFISDSEFSYPCQQLSSLRMDCLQIAAFASEKIIYHLNGETEQRHMAGVSSYHWETPINVFKLIY